MSANFELWKFDSLVQFARDATKRMAELEAENAELRKDRRDLLVEIRKLMVKEDGREDTPTR